MIDSRLHSAWKYEGMAESLLLQSQLTEMRNSQPYAGLSILHNVPLTPAAVCKIDVLLTSGAKVDVCRHGIFRPISENIAISMLREAGIAVADRPDPNKEYDLHLDTAGELASLPPPRIGSVEITQTGENIYKNTHLRVPVLSVNDSVVKDLETMLGTSEGFVRAFVATTKRPISEYRFLVFGFGRVGKGIVHRLIDEKTPVAVVTYSESSAKKAGELGIPSCTIQEQDLVHEYARQASAIVTATGVARVISDRVAAEFLEGKILINMGSLDEFGEEYSARGVLQHLNFTVDPPTRLRYLQVTFYAQNRAPLHLIHQNRQPGCYPYPPDDARSIVNQWHHLFPKESPTNWLSGDEEASQFQPTLSAGP